MVREHVSLGSIRGLVILQWSRDNPPFGQSRGGAPLDSIDPTQRRILDYITSHPGVYLREVCRSCASLTSTRSRITCLSLRLMRVRASSRFRAFLTGHSRRKRPFRLRRVPACS